MSEPRLLQNRDEIQGNTSKDNSKALVNNRENSIRISNKITQQNLPAI